MTANYGINDNTTFRSWNTPSSVLQEYLNSGESLEWSGQPKRGFRLQPKDAFLIPFSIFWCGFAVFWELMALGIFFRTGRAGVSPPSIIAIIFPLFGIPFVLIGLYLLFGRFVFDAMRRKKTYYGVTDKRILIIEGLRSQKVKSFAIESLTNITMTKKGDGTGTITFSDPQAYANYPNGTNRSRYGWTAHASLELIENVTDVYRLITHAQKNSDSIF